MTKMFSQVDAAEKKGGWRVRKVAGNEGFMC